MTRIVRCALRSAARRRTGRTLAAALVAPMLAASVVASLTACTSPASSVAAGASSSAGSSAAATSVPVPGTTSTAKPRTTSVPAPSAGTIKNTVAPVARGPVTKVTLAQSAVLPSKVTVSILSAKRKVVAAKTPGEIAGPAVVARIRIRNGTTSALDLGSSIVTLVDSAGKPGQATTAGSANPFTGTVAPGKSLDGVYVFDVPSSSSNPFRISVSYAGGAPVALFAGTVS